MGLSPPILKKERKQTSLTKHFHALGDIFILKFFFFFQQNEERKENQAAKGSVRENGRKLLSSHAYLLSSNLNGLL